MLRTIQAHNLGALGDVTLDLAERLTLLTGDNGLGKTLLLDLAWFAATGGNTARGTLAPQRTGNGAATIRYVHELGGATSTTEERFDPRSWRWERDTTPFNDSLVVYAHADGAFDVWDSFRFARHVPYAHPDARRVEHRFSLSTEAVWNGLDDDGRVLCNGLLRDWLAWQYQKPEVFARFARALEQLSGGLDEPLVPGTSRRVSPDDARDIPTLRLPYGEVPVTLCSAGMRRVLALAYVLVWALDERQAAAALTGVEAAHDIVLLVDEVEAHLHPRWQRLLLPALLAVLDELAPAARVQVVATTHAPLVLASLETRFDPSVDRAMHLERKGATVSLLELPWAPQGDAVNWLVSEAFGLQQARSVEAERAIEAAEAYMRGEAQPAPLDTREAIHAALRYALPDHDHFWPRWIVRSGVPA
ncbi:MAG: AAA family ATPase [Deltaproteobacteria bacterium]|nr:AAA family ATPase [Myxococcales bacterium]MDP3218724.1 AAA family ATPase [Deltaproteobacteria bacterium]